MHLFPSLQARYTQDKQSAADAQRQAQEIAFAPVVFQVSRLMLKFGILELLSKHTEGLTLEEITDQSQLSSYAVKVLMEASLTIGTVTIHDDQYHLAKTGWFLLNDHMVQVNLDFNHQVNYLGLYHLEEALLSGKPAGLSTFGPWATIYEGLSQLPQPVRESWFRFDHYYSDESFAEALKLVFDPSHTVRTLLDVGGNTGRWALQCVTHDPNVRVTIMDLPPQIELMRRATAGHPGADRIDSYAADLLDPQTSFPPQTFDVIWMSQFLDCFSEEQIRSILQRARQSMDSHTRLCIMETFWDRQQYETAAFCLTQTSLYFTAMANGNSKMYHSDDLIRCATEAGLHIETIHDGLGMGHTLLICTRA